MYDDYVKMKVEGLTRSADLRDACIIVLRAETEGRLYPIPLTDEDFDKITAALKRADFTPSRLMSKLARRLGMTILGVRVLRPHDGRTKALIDFDNLGELVSVSTPLADAVVCALENNVGIWLGKHLLTLQPPVEEDGEGYRMAIPIDAISGDLIEAAIKGAVKSENYELAGKLHEELQKRKLQMGTQSTKSPNEQG